MARKSKASEPVDYAQEPPPTPLEKSARAEELVAQTGGRVQHGSDLSPPKERPAFETRLGRVKAIVWANHTESGIRHAVTFKRIFKRDANSQWEESTSFGRDDLPALMHVAQEAWLWIFHHGSQGG